MRRLLLFFTLFFLVLWGIFLVLFYRADLETRAFAAIQDLLEDRAGISLTAEHVRWQIWPPRVEILRPELAFQSQEPFLEAERLLIRWSPSTLLLGAIGFKSVEVESPKLTLDSEHWAPLRSARGAVSGRPFSRSIPLVIRKIRFLNGVVRFRSGEGLQMVSHDFGLSGKIDFRKPRFQLKVALAPVEVRYHDSIDFIEMAQADLYLDGKELEWKRATLYHSALRLKGEGQVDLSRPKTLWSRTEGSIDLSILGRFDSRLEPLQGDLKGEWVIEGEIGNLMSHGHVEIEDLAWKGYGGGLMRADFHLTPKLLRLHPFEAALDGGKVEGELEIERGPSYPFSASMELHSFDLARLLVRFGLSKNRVQMGIEGEVRAKGVLGPSWTIETASNLKLSDFSILKRAFAEASPGDRAVAFADSRVDLTAQVSPDKIEVRKGLFLSTGTELGFDGSIVFGEGFDLRFGADSFDLRVAERVGRVPLAGVGRLSGEISGPIRSPIIDGQIALDRFEVVRLKVGSIEGPFRYRHRNKTLLFPEVAVQKGSSRLSTTTSIAFQKPPLLDVAVSFEEAKLADLSDLLGGRFPLDFLEGRVAGGASGELRLFGEGKRLNGKGLFSLKDPGIYGERFQKGEVRLGWIEGDVEIEEVRLQKEGGEVLASGYIRDRGDHFRVQMRSTGLNGRRIDRLKQVGLELDAPVEVEGEWSGSRGEHTLKATAIANTGLLNAESFQGGRVDLYWKGREVRIDLDMEPERFKGALSLRLDPGERSYRCSAEFSQWNVAQVIRRYLLGSQTALIATGEVSLRGSLDRWKEPEGVLHLQGLTLSQGDVSISLRDRAEVVWKEKYWSTSALLEGGRNRFSVDASFGEGEGQVIALEGELDLRLLSLFLKGVSRSDGELQLEAKWRSRGERLGWEGEAVVQGGFLSFGGLQQGFEGVEATLRFRGNRIEVETFEGRWGGGPIRVSGFAGVDRFRLEDVDLQLEFSNLFWNYPESLTAVARGKLYLSGPIQEPVLSGSVVASEVFYKKTVSMSDWLLDIMGGRWHGRVLRPKTEGGLQFNISIEAEDPVRVQMNQVDAELRGEVVLVGELGRTGLLGTLEVIQGGIKYRGDRFEIDSGMVDFGKDFEIDPVIQTEAHMTKKDQRTGTEYYIQMNISGSALEGPQVDFIADPVLTESQITQLLLFGHAGSGTPGGLGSFATSEAFSFTGGLLLGNFQRWSRSIEEASGQNMSEYLTPDRFELEPSFSSRTQTTNPRMTVGKDLREDLSVSYSRTIDVTGSGFAEQSVELDYRIAQPISILGGWNNEVSLDQETEGDIGNFELDLKFGFEFE